MMLSPRPDRTVLEEELRKHDAASDDPWLAVRGTVYSVKKYAQAHPGGVKQILRGAGRDATELFDAFHRWVNVDAVLATARIGTLGLDAVEKDARGGLTPPATLLSLFDDAGTWRVGTLQSRRAVTGGPSSPHLLRIALSAEEDGGGGARGGREPTLVAQVGRPLDVCLTDPVVYASLHAGSSPPSCSLYPSSLPARLGGVDLWVPGGGRGRDEAEGLEAIVGVQEGEESQEGVCTALCSTTPVGSPVWLRPSTAPTGGGVGQLGDAHAPHLPASALATLPPSARQCVQAGALAVLRSPVRDGGAPSSHSAVWRTGACARVKGVWCIAEGLGGLLPCLPLLAWAGGEGRAAPHDGSTPTAWLTLVGRGGELEEDTLAGLVTALRSAAQGGGLRISPPSTSPPFHGSSGEIQALVASALAPPPDAGLLVLVAASPATAALLDEGLRGSWYLASHCLHLCVLECG